jgi:hypothetical protein
MYPYYSLGMQIDVPVPHWLTCPKEDDWISTNQPILSDDVPLFSVKIQAWLLSLRYDPVHRENQPLMDPF